MNNIKDYKEGSLVYVGNKDNYIGQLLYNEKFFIKDIEKYTLKYGVIYHTNIEEEFFNEIDRFSKLKYCYPWREITEDQYFEMLECLPPENWQSFKGGNIFRMSEYTIGNITTHFMEKGDKYYQGSFDNTDYKTILELIK